MLHPHQNTIWGFVRTTGICLVLLALGSGTLVQAGEPVQDLEVFVRAGCPHCEAAKAFLKELQRERPAVRIVIYDVAEDSTAGQRLATLAEVDQQPGESRIRNRLASSTQVAYVMSQSNERMQGPFQE